MMCDIVVEIHNILMDGDTKRRQKQPNIIGIKKEKKETSLKKTKKKKTKCGAYNNCSL